MSDQLTVTVVPPEAEEGHSAKTQGTKVLLADGTELGLVTRIELSADINDLWRGTIELMPAVGVMRGMRVSVLIGQGSWWRTLLCRIAGATVDTTSLADMDSRWRKP